MQRLLALFALTILGFSASGLAAGERQKLGYGRLFTNDLIGDGDDRWRTGSVASSRVWGPEWTGRAPARFGEVLELRFGGAIIAPENLRAPAAGDRPYAGALSLGLHTPFTAAGLDMSVGADLVFVGPQTGLDDFQRALHDLLNSPQPSSVLTAGQVGNGIHPTLVAEAGRDLALGNRVRLRPFVEGRLGIETLARVGADLSIGRVTEGELLVRDPVTGQRYRVVRGGRAGVEFLLGADFTYVEDSAYFPSASGVIATDTRARLRMGLNWQSRQGYGLFYGLTWLDKEFETQRESQVVGSLRLQFTF